MLTDPTQSEMFRQSSAWQSPLLNFQLRVKAEMSVTASSSLRTVASRTTPSSVELMPAKIHALSRSSTTTTMAGSILPLLAPHPHAFVFSAIDSPKSAITKKVVSCASISPAQKVTAMPLAPLLLPTLQKPNALFKKLWGKAYLHKIRHRSLLLSHPRTVLRNSLSIGRQEKLPIINQPARKRSFRLPSK